MMSEPVAALISGSEAEKWAAKAVFLANSAATD